MIETRELVCRYGDATALDGVSLTIADGEFVVLAGANGSGKTTLVRQFNGLETPDEGDVLVDGTPVEDDLVGARRRVGMVFQNPRDQFVAATIGEDVAFGPRNLGLDADEIDDRVADALAAVGMDGRHEERIDRLSGGEGRDLLTGGGGPDVFEFGPREGRDRIEDFGRGRDRVAFESEGRFEDLRIKAEGGDALVIFEGTKMLLEDVPAWRLDADDFVFG